MTDTEIKECQEWLDKLKLDDIPKGYKWQRSLMDITGIKHHENMWSDIYKFFFDIKESHNLGDLFIRSLESLIGLKTNFLDRFLIDREFDVKGKRIDLLLCDNRNNKAIIIENKVNHFLDNDLNKYYEVICKKGYSEVIVVVLGLRKYDLNQYDKADKIPSGKYSITHYRFINEVISKLPEYYKQSNPKYLYLLQEFAKNITNMTKNMNTEDIKFYFCGDNRMKINKLADVRTRVINHISDSLENKDIIQPLFKKYDLELEIGKNKKDGGYIYYNFKGYKEKVMITLVYHRLWDFEQNGCRIQAILELKDDMMTWVQKHKSNKSLDGLNKNQKYWHYSTCDITFTTNELMENFQESLCQKLSTCPIYTEGIELIKQHKVL